MQERMRLNVLRIHPGILGRVFILRTKTSNVPVTVHCTHMGGKIGKTVGAGAHSSDSTLTNLLPYARAHTKIRAHTPMNAQEERASASGMDRRARPETSGVATGGFCTRAHKHTHACSVPHARTNTHTIRRQGYLPSPAAGGRLCTILRTVAVRGRSQSPSR